MVVDAILLVGGLGLALVLGVLEGRVDRVLAGCGLSLLGAADLLRMRDGLVAFAALMVANACLLLPIALRGGDSATSAALTLAASCVVGPLFIWRMQRLRQPEHPPAVTPAGRS
jgi:hypothetical protein